MAQLLLSGVEVTQSLNPELGSMSSSQLLDFILRTTMFMISKELLVSSCVGART
jgi:hypothetical protein